MFSISVLGGGSWGLAIGKLLCENGHSVSIWEYNTSVVEEILKTRKNKLYLPDVKIPESIFFSNDMSRVVSKDIDIIFIAIPSQFIRETVGKLSQLLKEQNSNKTPLVVSLTKGIESGTFLRMSEIIEELLPPKFHGHISVLSGPSHAEEVSKRIPTTVVIAGKDIKNNEFIQSILSNDYFRVYSSTDITGVEIGGSVKNIISIAAGIVDGLGLGDNTKGALLTRGLSEIKRLGVALGADVNTFFGLSGVGDLITTAISRHSRNRYVGYELGKGRNITNITSEMVMVAEGIKTTESIYFMKEKLNVEMPITDQIYNVIFKNKSPQQAVKDLMNRELKEED